MSVSWMIISHKLRQEVNIIYGFHLARPAHRRLSSMSLRKQLDRESFIRAGVVVERET